MFKDHEARELIQQLKARISETEVRLLEKLSKHGYVECTICGALIRRDKAIKIQTMVDKFEPKFYFLTPTQVPTSEKEIQTDYYCITHAPKKRK